MLATGKQGPTGLLDPIFMLPGLIAYVVASVIPRCGDWRTLLQQDPVVGCESTFNWYWLADQRWPSTKGISFSKQIGLFA